MEAALWEFCEWDRECQRARADLFAVFQTWMEGHPEPPNAAKTRSELERVRARHLGDERALLETRASYVGV